MQVPWLCPALVGGQCRGRVTSDKLWHQSHHSRAHTNLLDPGYLLTARANQVAHSVYMVSSWLIHISRVPTAQMPIIIYSKFLYSTISLNCRITKLIKIGETSKKNRKKILLTAKIDNGIFHIKYQSPTEPKPLQTVYGGWLVVIECVKLMPRPSWSMFDIKYC